MIDPIFLIIFLSVPPHTSPGSSTHPVHDVPLGAPLLLLHRCEGELQVEAALPEGAVLGRTEDRD